MEELLVCYAVLFVEVTVGQMVNSMVLVLLFLVNFLLVLLVIELLVGVVRGDYPGTTWNTEHNFLSGYEWQESPVYNQDVDGETKYGSSWGLLRRLYVGGNWVDGSLRGSRSIVCYEFSANKWPVIASRGCNITVLSWGGMDRRLLWVYWVYVATQSCI